MSGFGAYSSACEVIILLAGPAAGLALALVSSMAWQFDDRMDFFYILLV